MRTEPQQAKPVAQPKEPMTFMPVTLKPAEHRVEDGFVHVQRAATDIVLPAQLSADQIHSWLSAIHQLHV